MSVVPSEACDRVVPPQGSESAPPRVEDIAADKARIASMIAGWHFGEPSMLQAFRLRAGEEAEASPREPIKLLEVNANAFPSGVLLPVDCGSAPEVGIPYRLVIAEVPPSEFAKIQSGEWTLPRGWIIGEELPRPPEEAE
jgi:hypothetical protein